MTQFVTPEDKNFNVFLDNCHICLFYMLNKWEPHVKIKSSQYYCLFAEIVFQGEMQSVIDSI